MNSLTTIKDVIQNNKKEIHEKFSVKSLGIFGSYARNEQTESSDIDILVDFDKPIGLEFVTLADYLESLLEVKIDLVSRNAVKSNLMEYIERDIQYV